MSDESLVKIEDEIRNVVSIANPFIGRILDAQIQVIRFIREPMMMLSITDIMMQNLDMSLRLVSTQEERKWLKEQTSITIQHFLFLMHASLVFEINGNKDEFWLLLKEGGQLIGGAIADVLSYIGSGDGRKLAMDIRERLERAIDESKPSFWSRLMELIPNREKLKRKKNNFMLMLEKTLFKIGRRKNLFGKSIALSETIYDYIDPIVEHKKELAREEGPDGWLSGLAMLFFLPAIFLGLLGMLHIMALIPSKLLGLSWSSATGFWFWSSCDVLKWYVAGGLGVGFAIIGLIIPMKQKASLMKLRRRLKKIAEALDPAYE